MASLKFLRNHNLQHSIETHYKNQIQNNIALLQLNQMLSWILENKWNATAHEIIVARSSQMSSTENQEMPAASTIYHMICCTLSKFAN